MVIPTSSPNCTPTYLCCRFSCLDLQWYETVTKQTKTMWSPLSALLLVDIILLIDITMRKEHPMDQT